MELQTTSDRHGSGPESTDRSGTAGRAATELLTAQEACSVLGITDRTLRKWATQGRIAREFGTDGHSYYRRGELEELRNANHGWHPESGPERRWVRTGTEQRPDRNGASPEWHRAGPD
jgi:hypothetical protein